MLGQRRRRWTNIKTLLGLCIAFAGMCVVSFTINENTIGLPITFFWGRGGGGGYL